MFSIPTNNIPETRYKSNLKTNISIINWQNQQFPRNYHTAWAVSLSAYTAYHTILSYNASYTIPHIAYRVKYVLKIHSVTDNQYRAKHTSNPS